MIWLCLIGALTALYARWLLRRVGGPFRPMRNEFVACGRDALTALAVAFVIAGAGLGV